MNETEARQGFTPSIEDPERSRREAEGPALLDLSAPERIVRLRIAGHEILHVFRRLTLEDWLGYLKRCPTELVLEGDTWSPETNPNEGCAWLWQQAIQRIDGYKAGPDWKEKMPLAHIIAAVGLLQEVYANPSEAALDLEAESRTVVLEAGWNLRVYENLIHRFRIPTAQEALRYRRLNVQWFRQGGRRQQSLRIRMGLALRSLCELYDSLIESIEGYAGFERPQEMDPLHKQAAIVALFEPPDSEQSEELTPSEVEGRSLKTS